MVNDSTESVGHMPEDASGRVAAIQRRRQLLAAVFVVFTVFLGYGNAFRAGFILDDQVRILGDAALRHWPSVIQATTRPLTNLTFFANYRLSGFQPADFRIVNIGLHCMAGLVLMGIIRRTALLRGGIEPRATWLAAVVSSLWVVHPVQTESVTYIVQRAEVLAGLFMLLTVYAVVRSLVSRHALCWWCIAWLCCLLAVASKPVAVVIPLVCLAYDWVACRRLRFRSWLHARGVFHLGLWLCLLLPAVLLSLPNESSATTGIRATGVTALDYAMAQPRVIVHYLRLLAWPHPLCIDYAWPPSSGPGEALLYGLPLLALAAVGIVSFFRRGSMGYAWLMFFVLLAPTSSFVPIADFAAEHRLYLPSAAALGALAALSEKWMSSSTGRKMAGRRRVMLVSALLAICGCVVLTRARNEQYVDPLVMWRSVVDSRPENFRARVNLAQYLIRAGQYPEAERHCRDLLLAIEGARDEAMQGRAWMHRPEVFYPHAHVLLGRLMMVRQDVEQARYHFEEALRADPASRDARYHMALLLRTSGDSVGAEYELRRLVEDAPDHARAQVLLGELLMDTQRWDAAVSAFEAALRVDRHHLQARRGLALTLARVSREPGDLARALRLARSVCRDTQYRSASAQSVLAEVLWAAGDPVAAARAMNRAIEIRTRQRAEEGIDGAERGELEAWEQRRAQFRDAAGTVDASAATEW